MTADTDLTVWHHLDRFLARLRPHREPLSLLIDGGVIAACWHITYLFRLGFERWISARPSYDLWVLLGVVAAYLAAFALFRVPQSMWRFSGFGEVQRLTLACAAAGVASAAAVIGLEALRQRHAEQLAHDLYYRGHVFADEMLLDHRRIGRDASLSQ